MDCDERKEEQDIIKRFNEAEKIFYEKSCNEYHKIQTESNRGVKQSKSNMLKTSYPHLRSFKHSKKYKKRIRKQKALLCSEMLKNENFAKIQKFTEKEQKCIIRYCRRKIEGVYKHAQSKKTEFCNLKVLKGVSEPDTVTVLITKNSLESNTQWFERLCKDLNKKFPGQTLEDLIMIISSKKNILKENATHCNNMNAAWSHLKIANNIKVIFVCCNKIRMEDALDLVESYSNLKGDLSKHIRIQHDEAHSSIPTFRSCIESLLLNPIVLSYTPITATPNPIYDDKNPVWNKEFIEKNAMDYTKFNDSTSDDPTYSSCSDSIIVDFTKLQESNHFTDYEISKIPDEIYEYDEVYSEEDKKIKRRIETIKSELTKEEDNERKLEIEKEIKELNEELEKKKALEWCFFLQGEKDAFNYALNVLNINNFDDIDNTIHQLYIKNSFNLHVISTPLRKAFTHYLSIKALEQDYNPLVLAIYGNDGNKYHLFDKHENGNTPITVDTIVGKGEFNEKLWRLIEYLNKKNVNTERPLIIIGNYHTTGESLSFVNYKYGTVRSNVRLHSTNAEEDYQEACRSNYVIDKFRENDENWEMPPKYLLGPKEFLSNAISYEKSNDERIHDMKTRQNDIIGNDNDNEDINLQSIHENKSCENGTVSIPIKIEILDRNDNDVKKMLSIAVSANRTEQDKIRFLTLLKKCVDNGIVDFHDSNGNFNFTDYTLKGFRCYGGNGSKDINNVKKGQWKFTNYEYHFNAKTCFMNDRNNHEKNQCEILTCNGMYIIRDDNNHVTEKNPDNRWWMSYKY